jgi:GNAT superfamily N-acetyltransferase
MSRPANVVHNRNTILYREVSLDELQRRIAEIDVSEHGDVVYYWIDGEVKPVPEIWDRPHRSDDSWQNGSWVTTLGLPGVKAWGAFDSERLVGAVVYRPHLTEDMAQLAALFVSRDCRRMGIAARLSEEVDRQARSEGHSAVYVSATPSESAVNFYRSQGYIPTQKTHPDLYALEPEDIHMIKQL